MGCWMMRGGRCATVGGWGVWAERAFSLCVLCVTWKNGYKMAAADLTNSHAWECVFIVCKCVCVCVQVCKSISALVCVLDTRSVAALMQTVACLWRYLLHSPFHCFPLFASLSCWLFCLFCRCVCDLNSFFICCFKKFAILCTSHSGCFELVICFVERISKWSRKPIVDFWS